MACAFIWEVPVATLQLDSRARLVHHHTLLTLAIHYATATLQARVAEWYEGGRAVTPWFASLVQKVLSVDFPDVVIDRSTGRPRIPPSRPQEAESDSE